MLAHELEIPRVPRRDHGLAGGHRLGQRQAQALAAVERDVAVAGRDVGVAIVLGDVPVPHEDVLSAVGERRRASANCSGLQSRPLMLLRTRIGPSPGAERLD